jgi:predicted amidohydrolase YtcJ
VTGLVLRNGRIEGGDPIDLLIEDGTVVQIGSGLTARRSIDLDGRHVAPGLWDDHVHLSQHALAQRRVDVSAAGSAAEAAAIMAAAVVVRPPEPGLPLVGVGFRDGLWPDTPTATLLDDVTGALPTVLISGDLHCCWLNTAALDRFGVGMHPTGVLREDEAFRITESLQDVPDSVLDGWVALAAATAASRGVVGVVDFEMADNLAVWARRIAAGSHSLRIAAGIYTEHVDAAIAAGRRTGAVIAGTGGLLAVGPFKILIDGSLNTRTAFCVDEYPGLEGHPHSNGMLTVTPDALVSMLRRVSAAGFLPAVHAIGDDANRIALDAFETVGCRGRIEHAQLLRDADLPRFAALGVTASLQPEQAMDDRDVADRYWAGRTSHAFALRSLFDAGATVVLGSDAPVAPLDPWITIAAAVVRARDGLEAWHPEQSITAAEAIGASAHGRHRVALGDAADLCIVDIDPLAASGSELRAMPVSATLIAGRFTHNSLVV